MDKPVQISTEYAYLVPTLETKTISPGYAEATDFDGASRYIDPILLDMTQNGGVRATLSQILPGGTYEFGSGTASAPAIRFAADTNTGFYWDTAGSIKVSIDGTLSTRIREDGITVYVDATVGDGDDTNEGYNVVRASASTDTASVNFHTGAEASSSNCQWMVGLLRNNTYSTGDDLCISRDGASTRVMRFQNADGYVRIVNRLRIGADSAPTSTLHVTGSTDISTTLNVDGATTLFTLTTTDRVGINRAIPSYSNVHLDVDGDCIFRAAGSSLADGINVFRDTTSNYCRVHWHTGTGNPSSSTVQWNLGLRGDGGSTNDLVLSSISMTGSNLGGANFALRFKIGTTGHMLTGKHLGVKHPDGTTAPAKALEVTDSADAQMRLTHTAATDYADFTVDTNGLLTISPSGDVLVVDDALRVGTATDAVDAGDLSAGALSGNRIFWDQSATLLSVIETSTADPAIRHAIGTTISYIYGIDNSVSGDPWVLATAASGTAVLGTGNILSITSGGLATWSRSDSATTPTEDYIQSSTGDSAVRFAIGSTTSWAIGADNSATGDPFKIAYAASGSAVLGTTDRLTIESDGEITVAQWLQVGTATDSTTQGDFVTGLTGAARLFYDQSTEALTLYNSSSLPLFIIDGAAAQMRMAVSGSYSSATTKQIHMEGTQPGISMYDTTGGTNAKTWDFYVTASQLQLRTVNDAASVANYIMVVTRSGVTPTEINFNEDGVDCDFRVESNDETHTLFVDGGTNSVRAGRPSLATNATDGFLYVPACAGTPTGAATGITGMIPIVVDSTNHKLYFYSGGAWRDAGP